MVCGRGEQGRWTDHASTMHQATRDQSRPRHRHDAITRLTQVDAPQLLARRRPHVPLGRVLIQSIQRAPAHAVLHLPLRTRLTERLAAGRAAAAEEARAGGSAAAAGVSARAPGATAGRRRRLLVLVAGDGGECAAGTGGAGVGPLAEQAAGRGGGRLRARFGCDFVSDCG
jgi:hypothetical protein